MPHPYFTTNGPYFITNGTVTNVWGTYPQTTPATGIWLAATTGFWQTSNSVSHYYIDNATGATFYYRNVAHVPQLPNPAIIRRHEQGLIAFERSKSLYKMVRGESELIRFLAGKTIRIEGQIFNYRITKTVDLLEHTKNPYSAHIPYKLEAYSKAGRRIASGCVVIRETPVIDQIIAVVSHMHDIEEERHLLRTTNWTPHEAMQDQLQAWRNRRERRLHPNAQA